MSRTSKTIIGVASITAIGMIVYMRYKKQIKKQQAKLDRVADEGYETAYDVLFPLKTNLLKRFM
jgi:hypothetical protein